jgi:CCR4-NOT transcription complex subunit 1
VDAIIQTIISAGAQIQDEAARFTTDIILQMLFDRGVNNELTVESLVHVLVNLCKFQAGAHRHSVLFISAQSDENLFNVPLVLALVNPEVGLLDWVRIDSAIAKSVQQRKGGAVEFLSNLCILILQLALTLSMLGLPRSRHLQQDSNLCKTLGRLDLWYRMTETTMPCRLARTRWNTSLLNGSI